MNNRLQTMTAIAVAMLQGNGKYTVDGIIRNSTIIADALIDAAWEGGMSEKPTSHSEPIKSDWSIRSFFEGLRQFRPQGNVMITREQQDELCDLVEKHYGYPKPSVPRVGELKDWIYDNVKGNIDSIQAAEDLHAWLTERGAK